VPSMIYHICSNVGKFHLLDEVGSIILGVVSRRLLAVSRNVSRDELTKIGRGSLTTPFTSGFDEAYLGHGKRSG
jgi:hypothetical protein